MVDKPKRKAPNPSGKGGFKPGQSGNPGGYSAIRRETTDADRASIRAKIAKVGHDLVDGLIDIAMNKAIEPQHRISATKELFDRWIGKVTQPVDGDGDGGPVKVTVEWLKPEAS